MCALSQHSTYEGAFVGKRSKKSQNSPKCRMTRTEMSAVNPFWHSDKLMDVMTSVDTPTRPLCPKAQVPLCCCALRVFGIIECGTIARSSRRAAASFPLPPLRPAAAAALAACHAKTLSVLRSRRTDGQHVKRLVRRSAARPHATAGTAHAARRARHQRPRATATLLPTPTPARRRLMPPLIAATR